MSFLTRIISNARIILLPTVSEKYLRDPSLSRSHFLKINESRQQLVDGTPERRCDKLSSNFLFPSSIREKLKPRPVFLFFSLPHLAKEETPLFLLSSLGFVTVHSTGSERRTRKPIIFVLNA